LAQKSADNQRESLHTTDGEGAKEFYGSVFGWQPRAFGSPEAQMTLWRLPGYVEERRSGPRFRATSSP
jgi:predicted enzyme related to lactoylglutathione lyase